MPCRRNCGAERGEKSRTRLANRASPGEHTRAMDENELTALVESAAAGDSDALQRLIVHQHKALRAAMAAAMDGTLRGRVDPEDVLQQAYVSAFRSLGAAEFTSPDHFCNWLKRIAFDRLKDIQRAQRRQKRDVAREMRDRPDRSASYPGLVARLAGGESTPSRHVARDEAIAAVMTCLARLQDEQREVVRLRFLEDVPVAEIAERLGKTETAVYTLCHRGLKSLRERMASISRYMTGL